MYRKHLQKMREYMGIPITFKIGVETFNRDFRENYLNKHADFQSAEEVRRYFESPCLMVGHPGTDKRDDRRGYPAFEEIFSSRVPSMFLPITVRM